MILLCDICGQDNIRPHRAGLVCCKSCRRAFCVECGQRGPARGQRPGAYDTCNVCLGKKATRRAQATLF